MPAKREHKICPECWPNGWPSIPDDTVNAVTVTACHHGHWRRPEPTEEP